MYDSAETSFTTNGLGRLSSCVSCTVTEERNGIFECVFVYPITGRHYEEIQEGMIVGVIHDDSKTIQPFDIYKRSAPTDGLVTFYAHHISYRQSLIVVNPFSASTCALAMQKLKTEAVTTNPFNYVTDKQTAAQFDLDHPSGVRQILGGVQGSILDVFGGGEFKFDKWTTYLFQNRGQDTDVQIRYGKNLASIEKEFDISSCYNAVVPYWLDQQAGTIVMLPERVVYASGQSGTAKIAVMDLSGEFEEAPTETQLRQAATARLNASKAWVPDENIKVDFVALWQTPEYASVAPLQRVQLCDTVSVYYPELGVVANGQKVIKTVYNVLLERYDSMELGEAKTSFADMITSKVNAEIQQSVAQFMPFIQRAIDEATELITGGLGGYVVFNLNADGKPQEILVMDTDDITTAVNVIRINKNGIGFSQSGYNGPFNSAWTIDNKLNMAEINVINLTANLVRTGLLTDETGTNYWNLTTGEFRLAASATVGGQTVQTIANNAASGAVSSYDTSLNQLAVFNKLTNNGQTQGIYLFNNKLYINADYIQSGYISASRILGGDLCIGSFTGSQITRIIMNPNNLTNPTVWDGIWDENGIELLSGTFKSTWLTTSMLLGVYTERSTMRTGLKISDVRTASYSNSAEWSVGVETNNTGGTYGFYEHRDVKTTSGDLYQGTHPGSNIDYYVYFTGSSPMAHISYGYNNGLSIAVSSGSSSDHGLFLFQMTAKGIYYSRGSTGSASNDGLYLNFSNGTYKIAGNAIQFVSSSSKRYKHDITSDLDAGNDPHRLYDLQVKQFVYNDDAHLQYKDMAGQRLPGFIAEDVAEIYPAAVIRDADGKIESWDERRILPGVLALLQEQKKEIDRLTAEVEAMKLQINAILERIAK